MNRRHCDRCGFAPRRNLHHLIAAAQDESGTVHRWLCRSRHACIIRRGGRLPLDRLAARLRKVTT